MHFFIFICWAHTPGPIAAHKLIAVPSAHQFCASTPKQHSQCCSLAAKLGGQLISYSQLVLEYLKTAK